MHLAEVSCDFDKAMRDINSMGNSTGEGIRNPVRNLRAWGLIFFAGFLAFSGCLRADFYMDDFGFILNSNGDGPASRRLMWLPGDPVITGKEGMDTMDVSMFQLVPTGILLLTEKLVPDVVEASWLYHLWNLLLHLVTACLAWYAGRQILGLAGLLKNDAVRSRAAQAGAILFACHPLCSEPVHYAKCLNSITVAMFGMMMAGGAAHWLQTRSRRALWLAAGGLVGATLSYFPGMVLALSWLGLLIVFWKRTPTANGAQRRLLPATAGQRLLLVYSVCGVLALLIAWRWAPMFADQLKRWGPRYPEHIFTQGRLFWDYLARAVIPVGLSSDHYVPWSRPWLDVAATAKLILAFLAGVTGAVLVCSRHAVRLRGWALVVMMATVPLFMRFGYVNAEHFVEYRAYPAVPWLMLLFTTGLFQFAGRFPRSSRVPFYGTALLAMLCIVLSVQRSKVWTSREYLALDALAKSPLNPRPLTQLQTLANDSGNPDAVLALHEQVLALGPKLEAFARDNPGRYYARVRFDEALVNSCQWKVYALAEKAGSAAALDYAGKAIAILKQRLPERFDSNASGFTGAGAWPLLMARDAVSKNAVKIDADRASRRAPLTP